MRRIVIYECDDSPEYEKRIEERKALLGKEDVTTKRDAGRSMDSEHTEDNPKAKMF